MGLSHDLLRGLLHRPSQTVHAQSFQSALESIAAAIEHVRRRRAGVETAAGNRERITTSISRLPPVIAQTPTLRGQQRLDKMFQNWTRICQKAYADHGYLPPHIQHEFFARLVACALPMIYGSESLAQAQPIVQTRFQQWMFGKSCTAIWARRDGKTMTAAAFTVVLASVLRLKIYFGHSNAEYNEEVAKYLAFYSEICGLTFTGQPSKRAMTIHESHLLCFGHGSSGFNVGFPSLLARVD